MMIVDDSHEGSGCESEGGEEKLFPPDHFCLRQANKPGFALQVLICQNVGRNRYGTC